MSILEAPDRMAGEPKYKAVANVLRRRIRDERYPVGAKVPSVVDLSKELAVSQVTAHKGIRELVAESVLICHAGNKGTFVARREPLRDEMRVTTLACLLRRGWPRNETDNFGLEIVDGLRAEISGQGYRFIHHGLDEGSYERRMAELIQKEWVSGVILDHFTPEETIRRLAGMGVPAVLFNRLMNVPNLSAVSPDYHAAGRETFKWFMARGYRRIVFYPYSTAEELAGLNAYSMEAMYEGLREEVRAAGFPFENLSAREVPFNAPPEAVLDRLQIPRKKGRDWERLGILCYIDTRANQVIDAVGCTDLELGRDIGVIGFLDLISGRQHRIPPTTWRVDANALGRETVRELLARIGDPSLPRSTVKLPVEFVDRGTA